LEDVLGKFQKFGPWILSNILSLHLSLYICLLNYWWPVFAILQYSI